MLIRTNIPLEDEIDGLAPRRGGPTSMADLAAAAVGRVARKGKRARRRFPPTAEEMAVRSIPGASEAMVQRSIISAFQMHGIYSVHIPNEGRRSDWEKLELHSLGLAADFPDLLIMKRPMFKGLMEVKRSDWKPPRSGKALTAWQRRLDYHDTLRGFGWPVASYVRSVDEALAAVRAWGWVRG